VDDRKSSTTGARLATAAARVRTDFVLAAQDAGLLALSLAVMLAARFDGEVPARVWNRFLWFAAAAALCALLVNWSWRLYGQVWKHASVLEARRTLLAGTTLAFALMLLNFLSGHVLPWSVVVMGTATYTMAMGGIRFQARLFALRRNADESAGLRVAVVGAGELGSLTLRAMLANPRSGLRPVAVLDDDPRTHGRSFLGIRVDGAVSDLPGVLAKREVHLVVLAVGNPPRDLVRRVADLAEAGNVPLRMAPAVSETLRNGLQLQDLRDLSIEDLLGRPQVVTDLDAVRRLLQNKRVLITGAGGSIGSEIARQVARCQPAELLLLDHDETHLHDTCALLPGDPTQLLVDIRDETVVNEAFRRYRPEVVFHAAAHKHVPLLEQYPCEAVRTNVIGTATLVRASVAVGVERFVFISTDKAVRPSCAMGASKRVAEQIVLATEGTGTMFSAVRFGNVLGSRGSVVPTFLRQIRAGGPVTVTDGRMTRFFMSIPEAVQLVLQAAAMAEGREIFMLDMGEPVRILDLASRMVRLAGRRPGADVEIRITGVRPGEKLAEELREPDECASLTAHPSIIRLQPSAFADGDLGAAVAQLETWAARNDDAAARNALLRYAGSPVCIQLPDSLSHSVAVENSKALIWNPSTI
jgi:FlaA1/EpsC-like NDP-sugar epimerase